MVLWQCGVMTSEVSERGALSGQHHLKGLSDTSVFYTVHFRVPHVRHRGLVSRAAGYHRNALSAPKRGFLAGYHVKTLQRGGHWNEIRVYL